MSQEELEELIEKEVFDYEEEEVSDDKEEDSTQIVTECETKRLQKLQEDFIAKHKRVQKAECIFVYEKINE